MHKSRSSPRTHGAHPTLSLILLCALGAPAARAADTGSLDMQFDGYAHGLIVLKVGANLTLTPTGYAGRLTLRTAGMINWLSHMDSDSTVVGHFRGDAVAPEHYDSSGTVHGKFKAMHIAYRAGLPVIEAQDPPSDPTRTAVPAADTAGTTDTLSAMALLIRRVGAGGKCDGSVRLFDGRRLSTLIATTAGEAALPPSPKTQFNGRALRCDFVGTRIAGFVKSDDAAQQQRPRHGTAWLASVVPGAPPVPVRVTFDNHALGSVTLYLTQVTGGPGVVAQNAGGATDR